MPPVPSSTMLGTSPRAWGKRLGGIGPEGGARNIPTCVGKTDTKTETATATSEHPHVRGENVLVGVAGRRDLGTSPRAWGKLPRGLGCVCGSRNIPTCVGKTLRRRCLARGRTEHPHVRGENPRSSRAAISRRGTSPRAWGKLGVNLDDGVDARNIPTCVGKT